MRFRPPRASFRVLFFAALTAAHASAESSGRTPAPSATSTRAEDLDRSELERMLVPLTTIDGRQTDQDRRDAALAVEALGPNAVPAIGTKLAELRRTSTPAIAAAIKKARGASGGRDGDLSDALLETKSDGSGYPAALTTAVLLRALAHIGTTPAVRQLVRASRDHGGAFRPEIARHVKALGDKAVPALIESRNDGSAELRRWAVAQLEGMGKRVAGDAVQTQDNQVLADVLRAFTTIHDVDALPVLLSFVNSDRTLVRTAARESIEPFGQDAIGKLREAYSNVTGKSAPEGLSAKQIANELFSAYDRLRLQEVYRLLDEGLVHEKQGRLDDAIAAFDRVLARQPMIERRSEMVAAYVTYAKQLEDADAPRSLALLRKASRLWPEGPRTPQIEAEIAYLEGKELLAHGVADTAPFERALALDPTHEKSRAELARLETRGEERQERIRTAAAVGVSLLVALAGIVLFVGRGRPRRHTNA